MGVVESSSSSISSCVCTRSAGSIEAPDTLGLEKELAWLCEKEVLLRWRVGDAGGELAR